MTCESCSGRTDGKLLTQFADVESAFAGARIFNGTISAGYSQVMPSQPIAKKVLKMKRKSAATMPVFLPPKLLMTASITIEKDWPAAPKSML